MKKLKILLLSTLTLLITFPCLSQSSFRRNLKQPKLINTEEFKQQIPIEDLKLLSSYAKEQKQVMPLLTFFFIIDTLGNVKDGNFGDNYEGRTSFFKTYILEKFISYKWNPAFYSTNKAEKLRVTSKLSIYDNEKRGGFDVVIKFISPLDKEDINKALDTKSLFYKVHIK